MKSKFLSIRLKKEGKFVLPYYGELMYLNDEDLDEARLHALAFYYKQLNGYWPDEHRELAKRNGNTNRDIFIWRLDICREIFEKASMGYFPNNREYRVLYLEELKESDKYFCENLLISMH